MGEAGARGNDPGLLGLYRRMLLIRRAEERLAQLFADGEVPGFIHLSIGQEAVAVGVGAALAAADTLASNHRGHGHALAKGMPLDAFFLEVMGKAEGICAGRGGSMHVADMRVGMLGANGIVGAGLSLATGSALALQVQEKPAVATVFFGDGSVAEGLFHESLNLASLWKLPLLLVCENNGWAEFSPTSRQVAFRLEAIAAAFGIAYRAVDGNDVEAVAEAATALRGGILAGGGPALLECRTRRVRGHFEGDPQKYRVGHAEPEAEDPLGLAERRLAAAGVEAAALSRVAEEIEAEIEAAVATARAGAEPDFAAARAGVYTPLPAEAR